MQSIRKFHENHANITRHGKRHFLKVLSLLYLRTVKFDVGELTHAIDKVSNLFTELRSYIFFGYPCVLDDIM